MNVALPAERAHEGQRRMTGGGKHVLLILTFAVVLLGIAAFSLSFDALRDLAVASGIEQRLAWVWPLVVDGFICVATVAAVLLRPRGWRISWYPWATLALAACVSVAGNALHASVHADLSRVSQTVAALVSAVPPAALLCASHMLVVLLAPPPESQSRRWTRPVDDGHRGQSAASVQTVGVADGAHVSDDAAHGLGVQPVQEDGPVSRNDLGKRARQDVRPTTDELWAWVTQESAAGRRVTGAGVAERFGVSESTGRRWLQLVRDADRSVNDTERGSGNGEFAPFSAEKATSLNGSRSMHTS